MDDLKKFVTHVRNLKQQNVKQATFDVEYLHKILENVSPAVPVRQPSDTQYIIGDGGKFEDDE